MPYAAHRQQHSGEGTRNHAGDLRRGHEHRDCVRALARGEPVGEVKDDAREKSGFRDAEQKAQQVEAFGAARQHHRHRDDTPRNHDSADPDTRADPPQHEIAGYLEYEIADEEDAGAEAEGGGAQPELAVHLERAETNAHAFKLGYTLYYQHKGN